MKFKWFFLPLTIFLLLVFLVFARTSFADNPKKTGGNYEITIDNIDCGGDPSPGYTGGNYHIYSNISEPTGITILSGGNYVLRAGYLGQDLVAPSPITSFWFYPGGLARSITLLWSAPGDNERDDASLWGARVHIASTTVLSDAQNISYWENKRDSAEVQISTHSVAPETVCSYRMTDLVINTTYYFRIWTMDQATNWAALSYGATTYARPVILSVYVVDPSTYSYGMLETAISSISASGLIVRNDGNVNEDYLLRLTTGTSWPADTVWTSSTTAGDNRFVLYALFNSTRPATIDFTDGEGNDILTLNNVDASTTNFSDGSHTGTNIPPLMETPLQADTTLWLQLKTPLATSTTDFQTIPIIITAEEAD